MMVKAILTMIVLASVCGCSKSLNKFDWREDTRPVIKRLPVLSACTNMQWHGELISKNSLFGVPGPSAFRMVCFIPNVNQIIADIDSSEFDFLCVADADLLREDEIKKLHTDYGINVNYSVYLMDYEFTAKVIPSPYWGQCIYFKENQLLCIVLYGER